MGVKQNSPGSPTHEMFGLVLIYDRQQEVFSVVAFVACHENLLVHQGHYVLNASMSFGALFSVSLVVITYPCLLWLGELAVCLCLWFCEMRLYLSRCAWWMLFAEDWTCAVVFECNEHIWIRTLYMTYLNIFHQILSLYNKGNLLMHMERHQCCAWADVFKLTTIIRMPIFKWYS